MHMLAPAGWLAAGKDAGDIKTPSTEAIIYRPFLSASFLYMLAACYCANKS
jgi:hypothetical protein